MKKLKIHPDDLKMWAKSTNRDPWISAQAYASHLERDGVEIDARWGDESGELVVNGKIFEK